jgi:hypothetical protein
VDEDGKEQKSERGVMTTGKQDEGKPRCCGGLVKSGR